MVDLATKSLLHDKLRFIITLSGVAFAVMLVFVQAGLFFAAQALASEDSPLTAASRRRGAPQPTRWWSPACTRVEGLGAVTFTRDEGRNVVVSAPLTRLGYTLGLVPSHGKHIFRSNDGGATFSAVVDASAEVTLINGPVMAAHPTNPNVLYFVFGTYFQGYGTDIFRYDAASRALTKTHNDHDDVGSITFSPADPSIMYLGIVEESIR